MVERGYYRFVAQIRTVIASTEDLYKPIVELY